MSSLRTQISDAITTARTWAAEKIKPAAKTSDDAQEDQSQPAVLRSLSPIFDEKEHDGYVQVLSAELKKTGPEAPLNIALTGHYGSGKSSILVEAQRRLEEEGQKVINLSLPSLGVGDGRIPQDGDRDLERTNLIQKEIVKQLLYRRKPSDTPASRYNRLDTFDAKKARRRGGLIGIAALGMALLLGMPGRVEDSIPNRAWNWLNDTTFDHAATVVQWLSLILAFVLGLTLSVWVQRLLQQRLKVTELGAGAGPATVKLSEPTASYFDEYLDEIVYYFQTSETAIVIFEDLDRFKDPYIFETLRELNLLLNNAEQTGSEPIRFVYAIRDSIFEQLDSKPKSAPDSEPPSDGSKGVGSPTDKAETRRLVTTNRTKFFDLVVPVVPFISHRTSRDLMNTELRTVPDEHRPSAQVVDIVSAHITDMRLIKNICNEFDVFRTRILRDGGLKELTADKLFASIVYKNLFLVDYENIRNGTSSLDDIYKAYRSWVAQRTAGARSVERRVRMSLRRRDYQQTRSTQLGTRLQNVLKARLAENYSTIQVVHAGETYDLSDLTSPAFWTSFVEEAAGLQISYMNSPYDRIRVDLSFDKVQTLLGERLTEADWSSTERQEMLDSISQASADQRRFAHASLAEAVGSPDDKFTHDGDERSLEEVAQVLFEGAPIVVDLIRAGYIDENFTLYVTQFPGESSAAAMNFIIKSVQPNVMDINFHFGADEKVDESDIRAALAAESTRILNGMSVFNREIFDYLLRQDAEKLYEPISRLAAAAPGDTEFIDAYVGSGTEVSTFIRLLSERWPDIFDYVLGAEPEVTEPELLDAVIGGVNSAMRYKINDAQRQSITSALTSLPTVRKPQSARRSEAIATVVARMGISVPEIAEVAKPLFDQLVSRSAYSLTLANLQAIMGDSDVSLDAIKNEGPETVYDNVLENLSEYLELVKDSTTITTIRDPNNFADVLTDIHKVDASKTEETARLAQSGCMLESAGDVGSDLWPSLMDADRFQLSASNLSAYTSEYGVDSSLKAKLEVVPGIDPDEGDAEHLKLALLIVNEGELSSESRIRLVVSLGLPAGSVDVSELTADAEKLIPELVRRGLTADNADAFNALGEDSHRVKGELMEVSSQVSSYMSSLDLSTNDLHIISWPSTPGSIKTQLLNTLDEYSSRLGPKGATALTQWAARNGYQATTDVVVQLAAAAKTGAPNDTVKLLEPHAGEMDLESLRDILRNIGGPYAAIADKGWDRPKVPIVEGALAVLQRLQSAGIVSKFERDEGKGVFRVSKRR